MAAKNKSFDPSSRNNRVLLVGQYIEFEQENDLFSRCVDGIYYWHLLRKWIFDRVVKESRSFEFGGHPDHKKQFSLSNIKKRSFGLMLGAFNSLSGICCPAHSPKIVFLGNWKKTETHGRVQNMFLDGLVNPLVDDAIIFERPNNLAHRRDQFDSITVYSDWLEVLWGLSYYLRLYSRQAKEVFDDILPVLRLLEVQFQVNLDMNAVRQRILYIVSAYRVLTKRLEKIFTKWSPKCVVEIEHYSVFCLVCNSVLNKSGIPVIELQHGQIGPGHIAYNIIASSSERYLPTKIACFGEYWIDQCNMPHKESRMVAVGSIPLDRELNRLQAADVKVSPSRNNEKKVLLVISQGFDNGAIEDFVEDFLSDPRSASWDVWVKLHPSEVISWREVHPKLKEQDGIRIVLEGTSNELVVRSDAVVGISSTVLFEALAFSKPVFVLRSIDSEIAFPLVEAGHASLISNSHGFFECFHRSEANQTGDIEYVWRTNAADNTLDLIKRVVRSRSVSSRSEAACV